MEQIFEFKETPGRIKDAAALFGKIKEIKIDHKQENFIAAFLDTRNKLIAAEVIFKGGLNACLICPKTLFRRALELNANALIIAHNHPSGDLEPSIEDRKNYGVLVDAGNLLQISVLDSIIFNKEHFYSIPERDIWR